MDMSLHVAVDAGTTGICVATPVRVAAKRSIETGFGESWCGVVHTAGAALGAGRGVVDGDQVRR
jgi:hypothetical protein